MDIQPLHTKVEKSIQTIIGEIVLEDPFRFPRGESNLYCISLQSGKIVWKAEKPEPYTLYSRVRLGEDGETVSAYTIGGHACELEFRTGKLISHTVIK
jgi:hypothetical protein